MKRKLLMLGLALLCGGAAYSQNYYVVGSTGAEPYIDINNIPGNASLVMTSSNGDINDQLSGTMSLPFNWTFYGNTVKDFKISDNGYITFDVTSTTSVASNTTLPSASAPKNAIFAFWDDLALKSFSINGNGPYKANIYTWTYGQAPNRTYVISWFQLSSTATAAGTNIAFFALRIHEGAGFDVVNEYNTGNFTATVGAQNADASVGFAMQGSPDFGNTNIFTNGYDGPNSPVYNFYYGVQSSYDAGVSLLTLPKVVAKTDQTQITGVLTNYGTTQITSFDLNYSVDGGATVTQSINNVSIDASGGTYAFTHGTAWTGATAGVSHTVKVWASNINGNADQNTSNDAMQASVFVNNGVYADKKVLLEEGTGAWCGWCPVGHYNIKQILEDPNNTGKLIPISIHNNDGMSFSQGDSINSMFQVGYPYLMIDRFSFPELYGKVGNGNYISPQIWGDRVASRLASATSPVKLEVVSKSIDANNVATVNVKATFVDYATGNLRLNCYIVEDSMRGPDKQNIWTQHNYASKMFNAAGYAGTNHPLYNEDQWLVGYKHLHVLRAVPSGAWGTPLFPSTVTPGSVYTYTYKYKVPNKVNVSYTTTPVDPLKLTSVAPGVGQNNIDNMKVVLFVSNYDKTNLANNEILNAYEETLSTQTGLNEIAAKNITDAQVYPNPTNSETIVNFNLGKSDQVNISVYNQLGQKIEVLKNGFMLQGANTLSFDAGKYSNGVYFLSINTGGESISHRFVVVK